MGWIRDRFLLLKEAGSHKKLFLTLAIGVCLLLGTVDFLKALASKVASHFVVLPRPGGTTMIFGFPSWILGLSLALFCFAIWMMEYAASVRNKITPKLIAVYDEKVLSCDAIVGFRDGTQSRCIRLKVENVGTGRLYQCEGWLESIREFPRLSPARLFWVGIPEDGAVDLTNGIPRFLQILRIHQTNTIIPATYGVPCEQWPVDLQNKFVPGRYLFRIGLKGHDDAETVFSSLELNWTGDWKTATVRCT